MADPDEPSRPSAGASLAEETGCGNSRHRGNQRLSATIDDIYAPIQAELHATRARLLDERTRCDPRLADFVDYATRSSGKLVRPALLLLAGRACGELSQAHVEAAAVVELVHTATLIHDDVIDEAQERRRDATAAVRWGSDLSIMLGDLLFARAIERFALVAGPREQRILTRAIHEVCEGELLQLLSRREGTIDEQAYIQIVSKKTGALCAAACALGAAFAGVADDRLAPFAHFGRAVGTALQIADDCLDIRGDEHTVGKTLGLDLLGGKLTLPLIAVREHGTPEQRRRLEALVATPEDDGWRARLAAHLAESGAFGYCERTAHSVVDQAAASLAVLGECPAVGSLLALADFVIRRDR